MSKKKYDYREQFEYHGVHCDVVANSERELGAKIEKKKAEVDGARRVVRGVTTVSKWIDTYIDVYRAPACGESQYEFLCILANKHIKPYIGAMLPREVKKADCQRILNNMRGLSKWYIDKARQFLFSMFEAAVDEDPPLIARNPSRGIIMPQADAGTHRALTDAERAIFETLFAKHPRGCWAEYMLMFGPRPGETDRLYGRHIDIDGQRIFIDGTKSKASKRWVPMRDDMSDRLRAFLEAAAKEPFLPVFVQDGHKSKDKQIPITKWARRKWWSQIKAGYTEILNKDRPEHLQEDFPADLVPYCFRHTYATDLKGFGVPLEIKAEYLGHKPDVTEIYTHHSDVAFELGRNLINQAAAARVASLVVADTVMMTPSKLMEELSEIIEKYKSASV